ncbi:MAG: hypothetical protein ACM3N0_13325 [Chloroflexota bacterium]
MHPTDPAGAREFLEAVIAAFSLLGGCMAYLSGYYAARALDRNATPDDLAHVVNEGIGVGFKYASPASIVALIIMVWS